MSFGASKHFQARRVVAVVGKGHLRGVVYHLEEACRQACLEVGVGGGAPAEGWPAGPSELIGMCCSLRMARGCAMHAVHQCSLVWQCMLSNKWA
jgi:hypothetical protein